MLDKSILANTALADSQSDIAYETIRSAIVGCDLAPGLEVSEAYLAKMFEIGRGPVRLALARLRQEGLVTVIARRGYRITQVTLRDVRDMFALRRLVEQDIARNAAGRVNREHLICLDAICANTTHADIPGSAPTIHKAHQQLHLEIALAAGNRRAAKIFSELWDSTARVLRLGQAYRPNTQMLVHSHEPLIEALAQGDGEGAAALVGAELDQLFRIVVDTALASDSAIKPAPPASSTINGAATTEIHTGHTGPGDPRNDGGSSIVGRPSNSNQQ